MTEKIKFSVVIPLYNKENLVNRAINSVLSQTYDEYEIIVVNDGSTDNSVKSIEPFIMSGKVRLINKDNGGVSSARNVGILKSNNKYVAFLDADDTWDINFLEVISSLICKTKNAALWGGRQRLIKPDGEVIYSGVSYLDDNYKNYVYDYFHVALDSLLFHASCIVIDREKIARAKIYFDEKLVKGEDIDFYVHIALYYDVAFVNKVVSTYYLDAENSAMKRYCPLSQRFIGNITKYDSFLLRNLQFKKFVSEYSLTGYVLLLSENYSSSDIYYIKKSINWFLLPFGKKIFYFFPDCLKRIVYLFFR